MTFPQVMNEHEWEKRFIGMSKAFLIVHSKLIFFIYFLDFFIRFKQSVSITTCNFLIDCFEGVARL